FCPTLTERLSGVSPACQPPVPAESIRKSACGSLDCKTPSAKGLLQIFPKQTIKIFVFISKRLYREFLSDIFNKLFEVSVCFYQVIYSLASMKYRGMVSVSNL